MGMVTTMIQQERSWPHPAKNEISSTRLKYIITGFLQKCNLEYPICPPHPDFTAHCINEATRRGYISSTRGDTSFKKFIPGGVAMACNAYAHQPLHIKVFICFYTAFLIYVDDAFQRDITAVESFNRRFVTNQAQGQPQLDQFAALLREMPVVFGNTIVANVMTTSTLNFMTAQLLEHEINNLPNRQSSRVQPSAPGFPTFCRVMTGASETYALFAFPPGMAVSGHIQALPDIMTFINNGNDILSFYKEQLSGETANRVYLTAQARCVNQAVVLDELITEAAEAHLRGLDTLKVTSEQAYSAYKVFSQGYIGFHASLARYKLAELMLVAGSV